MMKFLYGLCLLMLVETVIASPRCGTYGAPPCPFVPAQPGETPSCVHPGKTYCEHVKHYPREVIKHLVAKYGGDLKGFIADESREEFQATKYRPAVDLTYYYVPPPPQPTYGPPPQLPPAQNYIPPPSPVYGPPSNHINTFAVNQNGYKYGPPPKVVSTNFGNGPATGNGYQNVNYNDPIYYSRPNNQGFNNQQFKSYDHAQQLYYNQQHAGRQGGTAAGGSYDTGNNRYYYGPPQVTQYNPADYLRQYGRHISRRDSNGGRPDTLAPTKRVARSPNNRPVASDTNPETQDVAAISTTDYGTTENSFATILALPKASASRQKRQSPTPGSDWLCAVRTQFIKPQVALNNVGNWMYVINEETAGSQLVKTEVCDATECSNLCQLPNGYSSKCEQRYIQKRLIALEGDGQRLYTDVFWFPSCCVCTITAATTNTNTNTMFRRSST